MRTKRRESPSKKSWAIKRAPYTWHLHPPFNNEFDRLQWWKGKPADSIKPIACLYELARRHPRIGQLRLRFHSASWYGLELRDPLVGAKHIEINSKVYDDLGREPAAIQCLCQIGLKCWVELPYFSRDYWMAVAGNLKGLDNRDTYDCCYPITLKALVRLLNKRDDELADMAKQLRDKDMTKRGISSLFEKEKPSYVFTADEKENAVISEALQQHRKGHFLFSFAPDLKNDTAGKMLEYEYAVLKKALNRVGLQRAVHENWLPIISGFEETIASSEVIKRHQFTKYKRVMDSVQFEFHNPLNKIDVARFFRPEKTGT